jgi:hypothetical protein
MSKVERHPPVIFPRHEIHPHGWGPEVARRVSQDALEGFVSSSISFTGRRRRRLMGTLLCPVPPGDGGPNSDPCRRLMQPHPLPPPVAGPVGRSAYCCRPRTPDGTLQVASRHPTHSSAGNMLPGTQADKRAAETPKSNSHKRQSGQCDQRQRRMKYDQSYCRAPNKRETAHDRQEHCHCYPTLR